MHKFKIGKNWKCLITSEGYYLSCYVGSHGIRSYTLLKSDNYSLKDVIFYILSHKKEHTDLIFGVKK